MQKPDGSLSKSQETVSADKNGTLLKVGDRVKCVKTEYYFMGQCKDDKITRGSTNTIDNIDDGYVWDGGNNRRPFDPAKDGADRDRRGWLFFKEHADRYGGWNPKSFVKI